MWIWATKRSRSSNEDQVSKDHELETKMAWLFGKKQSGKLLRIFFATDLHGSQHAFRKFINAAKFYEANVLIMGGDVLGKSIIPVVKYSPGRYRATVQGETEEVQTEAELEHLLNRIGAQGAYSKVMIVEEYQAVHSDPSALDNLFHELAHQRLSDWVDCAERRVKGTGVKCYITCGNDYYQGTLLPLPLEAFQSVVGCEVEEVSI